MALTLEIEFLSGVCYAALGPDSDAPDWPPQPDRVYSALVATWAAHGQPDDERVALEWLERLPAPACVHSEGGARGAPTVYVPPNDPSSGRAKLAAQVMPMARQRKPRRFPAIRAHDPVVRHQWHAEPDDVTLNALERLARDTSYVGHSTSLTRCRFVRADEPPASDPMYLPRRRIYSGRLQELCAAYTRFERSAVGNDRPSPGALVTRLCSEQPAVRSSVFSSRWMVLEHVGGEMCDLRAAAVIARGIRIALMSGYGQLGLAVPAEVSGHETDRSAARRVHMAVVPLSFTGFAYGDGRVMGFALVPPAGSELLDDRDFRSVLRRIATRGGPNEGRCIHVKSPEGSTPLQAFALRLAMSFEASVSKHSLDPKLYTGAARDFATVTPIALDRHPKLHGAARQEEMAALVAVACERIGLPTPESVRIDPHASLEGAPSAYRSRSEPAWMGWRLPGSLAGRPLTHALIRFKEPVEGPVLLGAGRFVGMGLCRPLGRGSA